MSLGARSPSSRKSLSLAEHNINMDNMTMPVTNSSLKGKKRGVSIGGEGLYGVALQNGKGDDLSPRRKARRSMQPRKSILKSLSSQSVSRDADDETVNFNQQYAHTIAFGLSAFANNENVDPASNHLRQSMSRRVSFAPNAHVRMFEKPVFSPEVSLSGSTNVAFALPPGSTSAAGARQSTSSHSRRSSFQNLGSVSRSNIFAPDTFQGEGEAEGEASMELESDDDVSDSGDEAVEMGSVRRYDGGDQIGSGGLVEDAGMGDEGENDDKDDVDMDMDITQNVYGGIIRRASMAPDTTIGSEGEVEADISQRSADDEKTMDFTIAIGGLLPHSPPVGAMNNRSSIGYSTPAPSYSDARVYLPGEAIEGEVEMEMEETIAFGGILGADDSLSSAGDHDTMNGGERERTMTFSFGDALRTTAQAEEETGMDMTVAQGGIISYPAVSPARRMPTNTRPMSGTPSFARPTVSSVQKSKEKEKRNVFAPSPSPTKSTTPKKSGMQTANEVAKRLSFGSTTSSGGRKRAREDDVIGTPGSNKKNKVGPATSDEIFGGTPVLRVPTAARASLGTPMRIARSPAGRQSMVRVVDPEVRDEAVEDLGPEEDVTEPEWEQPQAISLGAFLEMTGVQFMEGLPGLLRRRSSVAKGVLGQSYASGDREFALHEYAEAQVNSIFLNMYSWAANKLRDDIKAGQEELSAVEARCDIDSPPVIQEYLAATDDDKPLFEMTFKSFKTNTHLKAKEMWYDWKQQLIEAIKPDVEGMLQGMSEDNERLSSMNEQLESLLPDLRARQAALKAELLKERETVAEIAACDQEELAALKEGITEQGAQITNFNSELTESTVKLNALSAKLDELNMKKQECVTAIAHATSQCDQFTRSDAIRLQEEYTSIQHLHHWRPTKIHTDHLELEFDNEIALAFSCTSHVARPSTARALYLHDKIQSTRRGGVIARGQTPTEGMFDMLSIAVEEMAKAKSYQSLPEFVQRVGQLWSTAQRIRAELHYVNFRHPLRYNFDENTASLIATVTLMLPQVKSKVEMDLIISQETLWGYPDSLAGTELVIRQIYGKADTSLLADVARQTMGVATSQGCMGTFLQVCVDVGAQYEQRR